MCHHAGFRWGGGGQRELSRGSGVRVRAGPVWERAALWVVRFVLCFLLICIVVVTVPFVCCSVELPLSRPTSFCLFLPILLRTPAGGGAVTWRFCCWPQPNHNTRQTWCPTGHFLPTCFPAGQYRTLQFLQFMRFPSAHFSNLRFSE